MYRINFGNGGVSQRFATLTAAAVFLGELQVQALDPARGGYFIEAKRGGRWTPWRVKAMAVRA